MKKKKTPNQSKTLLKLMGISAISACLITSLSAQAIAAKTNGSHQSASEKNYKDGTYKGSARGFGGKIVVSVRIKNKKIKSVKILSAKKETKSYLKRARSVLKKIVKKNSARVDAVSGATASSEGIIKASKKALKKARKSSAKSKSAGDRQNNNNSSSQKSENKGTNTDIEKKIDPNAEYKDGSYTEIVQVTPDQYHDFDPYDLTMTVKINNNLVESITDVKAVSYLRSNEYYIYKAVTGISTHHGTPVKVSEGVVEQIVGGNSADADAVSGATCVSDSIMQGVSKALAEAKIGA